MNELLGLGGYAVDDDEEDEDDEDELSDKGRGTPPAGEEARTAAPAPHEGLAAEDSKHSELDAGSGPVYQRPDSQRPEGSEAPTYEASGLAGHEHSADTPQPVTERRPDGSVFQDALHAHAEVGADKTATSPENDHVELDMGRLMPAAPSGQCPPALQARVENIITQQRVSGKNFLKELRDHRDFRNPLYMEATRRLYDIDDYGTCFDAEIFDPKGLPKEDYLSRLRAIVDFKSDKKPSVTKRVYDAAGQGATNMHVAAMPASKAVVEKSSKRRARWDQ